jgi:hypothetical protein
MSHQNGETDSEALRRRAHRDYERAFSEMRAAWSPAQLAAAVAGGYDKPLPYEESRQRHASEDDEFHDPADRAVDDRTPIVDFDAASGSELQTFCDEFRGALVWATRGKNGSQPDLMQMGARMLTIFGVMAPQLKIGMDLRIPRKMEADLIASLNSADPLEIGKFFRRPLAWVRKCTSLVQLGNRGYSMVYVLCGDLINSATCAAIGGLDNKSRQAANKRIQDFRDTFGGIKSLPMRGKETRKRCKRSQEKN